jgi:hypothetical protein
VHVDEQEKADFSQAKLLGVVLLLAPVPARLKEWAYAGFAITLGSALVAHLSIGEGPEAGLGGGHRRALGALVFLLAPPAGFAGERLTAVARQCAISAGDASDVTFLDPIPSHRWTQEKRHDQMGTAERDRQVRAGLERHQLYTRHD